MLKLSAENFIRHNHLNIPISPYIELIYTTRFKSGYIAENFQYDLTQQRTFLSEEWRD